MLSCALKNSSSSASRHQHDSFREESLAYSVMGPDSFVNNLLHPKGYSVLSTHVIEEMNRKRKQPSSLFTNKPACLALCIYHTVQCRDSLIYPERRNKERQGGASPEMMHCVAALKYVQEYIRQEEESSRILGLRMLAIVHFQMILIQCNSTSLPLPQAVHIKTCINACKQAELFFHVRWLRKLLLVIVLSSSFSSPEKKQGKVHDLATIVSVEIAMDIRSSKKALSILRGALQAGASSRLIVHTMTAYAISQF